MSFDQGTYVRFRTLIHGTAGVQEEGRAYSGIYRMLGSEIIDLGILPTGSSNASLDIRCRLDGTLSYLNDQNEPIGASFRIPYYVEDTDSLLDEATAYWFYLPPSYNLNYDYLTHNSLYAPNAYSDAKYFLVSGGNTNYSPVPAENEGVKSNARPMNARATWVHDTTMYNLVGTGRRWVGELFDFTTSRTYDFLGSSTSGDVNNAPVPGTEISFKIKAVARASTNSTKLIVEYDGQTQEVAFPAVGTSSISNYVQEKVLQATFTASNAATFKITYDKAGNNSAAMWLDEMVVDWETEGYEYSSNQFFQNNPRGATNYSQFKVQWQNCTHIFGIEEDKIVSVVEPAAIVPTGASGINEATWYSHEDKLRTYKLSNCSTKLSFVVDEVVDLNVLDTDRYEDLDGVESIIIAPDSLLNEARSLADLESETGVVPAVVALSYIYDVVNTGNPDIGAIRKFLSKVFTEYGTLKYVTLFGDASYDYKGKLLGTKSNLVPTFESNSSFSLYLSYITDDFYGYLEPGESTNWFSEDLDVGIGRIPVRSKAEARAAVDKIEAYLTDTALYGPWRNKMVFVADDADDAWEREFATYQDQLARYLDTSRSELNAIKIYTDAYAQESMPGSQRYPEAREKLFREVEDGAIVVSYVGHGGEVGWATERVLQLEDINGWTNKNSGMPVFTTITCEFTRFDDPNRVSAGEQLFTNPNGGAIALMSTTRSVFATTSTYELNQLLNRNLMTLEDPRLGDVIRRTKNQNGSGDKIKFSLIGDAALPLARPYWNVALDSINGNAWSTFTDTINALNWVQLKGSVRHPLTGDVQSDYQGKVWLTVYDKKQNESTLVNDGAGAKYNFTTQNNTVFKGLATVRDGKFQFEFRVPLDINLSIGEAKFSTYTTDYKSDGWGGQREMLIGGLYEGIVLDTEGPEVRLFIDDTTFQSGGIADSDPDGLALLYDESGINAVGLGIGHNLTLTLDGEEINVNSYYSADLDDFQRGTVRYPFYNLETGRHSLEIRAWDVLNQWGYDSLHFYVLDADDPILESIQAYPNPFTEYIEFVLNHNQSDQKGTLRLEVVNNQGQVLWNWEAQTTLRNASTQLPTFRMSEVPGGRPAAGFYHVRILWQRESDGKSARIQEKLIYIR